MDVGFSSEGWFGYPQVFEFDANGDRLMVINFHAMPPDTSPGDPYHTVMIREYQVRELMAFITEQEIPVIALGDLNATDQNVAYKMITTSMVDAWREKGFGLGNTHERLWNYLPPKWFVRIDHIFHSHEFETIAAQVGPWDGYSDHRPVVAELVLRNKGEELP